MEKKIWDYLINRGITADVLTKHKIGWNGLNIVIPIHYGNPLTSKVCFNKYRRSPLDKDPHSPKYRYDKGSYARLYNQYVLDESKSVIICEGELDVLALESNGYAAVSSTGGSGTFSDKWVHLFDTKEVYICYDTDKAGVFGALRVQSLIPHAKIVWLPEHMNGKDVTDLLQTYGKEGFEHALSTARTYIAPITNNEFPYKKTELKHLRAQYSALVATYKDEFADATRRDDDRYWYPTLIDELTKQIQKIDNRLSYGEKRTHTDDKVRNAKSHPITSLLDFNNVGKCHCPWHPDSTPSLQYYPDSNTVHCFGGCGHKDAIDVYMKLHGKTFIDAVNELNNGN